MWCPSTFGVPDDQDCYQPAEVAVSRNDGRGLRARYIRLVGVCIHCYSIIERCRTASREEKEYRGGA